LQLLGKFELRAEYSSALATAGSAQPIS